MSFLNYITEKHESIEYTEVNESFDMDDFDGLEHLLEESVSSFKNIPKAFKAILRKQRGFGADSAIESVTVSDKTDIKTKGALSAAGKAILGTSNVSTLVELGGEVILALINGSYVDSTGKNLGKDIVDAVNSVTGKDIKETLKDVITLKSVLADDAREAKHSDRVDNGREVFRQKMSGSDLTAEESRVVQLKFIKKHFGTALKTVNITLDKFAHDPGAVLDDKESFKKLLTDIQVIANTLYAIDVATARGSSRDYDRDLSKSMKTIVDLTKRIKQTEE